MSVKHTKFALAAILCVLMCSAQDCSNDATVCPSSSYCNGTVCEQCSSVITDCSECVLDEAYFQGIKCTQCGNGNRLNADLNTCHVIRASNCSDSCNNTQVCNQTSDQCIDCNTYDSFCDACSIDATDQLVCDSCSSGKVPTGGPGCTGCFYNSSTDIVLGCEYTNQACYQDKCTNCSEVYEYCLQCGVEQIDQQTNALVCYYCDNGYNFVDLDEGCICSPDNYTCGSGEYCGGYYFGCFKCASISKGCNECNAFVHRDLENSAALPVSAGGVHESSRFLADSDASGNVQGGINQGICSDCEDGYELRGNFCYKNGAERIAASAFAGIAALAAVLLLL